MTGFGRDIRVLFRLEDRIEMKWAFDLWSYDDVVQNATVILERLEDASMPCDEAWSNDRIQLFRAWIELGYPP